MGCYPRRAGRVIAYELGEGIDGAMNLYRQEKRRVGKISCIYPVGHSSYSSAFRVNKVAERPVISKTETHLIESSNSGVRDNLARFNRRGNRFSNSWRMLNARLLLFFNQGMINLSV